MVPLLELVSVTVAPERNALLGSITIPAIRPPTSAHARLSRTETAIAIRANKRSTAGRLVRDRGEFSAPSRLEKLIVILVHLVRRYAPTGFRAACWRPVRILQFIGLHFRINPDTGQGLAWISSRDPDAVQAQTGHGGNEIGRHDFLPLETPIASA